MDELISKFINVKTVELFIVINAEINIVRIVVAKKDQKLENVGDRKDK